MISQFNWSTNVVWVEALTETEIFFSHSVTDALYPGTPGTDVCFARQHNTSDNNNQCFLGTNGNSLLQLNPQKPGAIDNQPLVTQEPVKVNIPDSGKYRKSMF